MGRTRKPLAAQSGDLTVARQQQRAQEEQLAAGNTLAGARPPRTLVNREALKLWKWAIEEMQAMPLLCTVDLLNLEGMCNAFALYREASAVLRELGLFTREGDNADMIRDRSDARHALRKYAEEYRSFARLCGFTVDSRLKLAAVKTKELDEDIAEEFGDI